LDTFAHTFTLRCGYVGCYVDLVGLRWLRVVTDLVGYVYGYVVTFVLLRLLRCWLLRLRLRLVYVYVDLICLRRVTPRCVDCCRCCARLRCHTFVVTTLRYVTFPRCVAFTLFVAFTGYVTVVVPFCFVCCYPFTLRCG